MIFCSLNTNEVQKDDKWCEICSARSIGLHESLLDHLNRTHEYDKMVRGSAWETRPLELYHRLNEGYSFNLSLDLKNPLKSELKIPSSQNNAWCSDLDNKENHDSQMNSSLLIRRIDQNGIFQNDGVMRDDDSLSLDCSPAHSTNSNGFDTGDDDDSSASKESEVPPRKKLPTIKIKIKHPKRILDETNLRRPSTNVAFSQSSFSKDNLNVQS